MSIGKTPKQRFFWSVGLCALTLLGLAFCGGGMLAEGPHGPKGEITGDPVMFPLALIGLPFALLGFLYTSGMVLKFGAEWVLEIWSRIKDRGKPPRLL